MTRGRLPTSPASTGHNTVPGITKPAIRKTRHKDAEPAQHLLFKTLEHDPFREGLEREEIGLHHIRILQVRSGTMRRQIERRGSETVAAKDFSGEKGTTPRYRDWSQ